MNRILFNQLDADLRDRICDWFAYPYLQTVLRLQCTGSARRRTMYSEIAQKQLKSLNRDAIDDAARILREMRRDTGLKLNGW